MATRSRSRSKSRGRSQSLSQFVVGTAAMGLPAPVRDVASTPWGSRLVLIGGALALASGVLTISWDGTIPSVKINHDRAKQVRQEIATEVQQFQQQQLKSGKFGSASGWMGESNPEQPNPQQSNQEQNNWAPSAPNSWPNTAPNTAPPAAPNNGSNSNLYNSVQSALGAVSDRTAPGPNSFQQPARSPQQQSQSPYQQAQGAYQQAQSPYQQTQGPYQQSQSPYQQAQDSVQGAYNQVKETYRQAQEQVESSPLFAPRTKVTR